jgi:glyoxylase-like metal-dependent hydrolase (beta-lactamase superfamily II)
MYAIEQLAHDLWLVTLPKPVVPALPGAAPCNVYVATGDHPALVNAGHPGAHDALVDALSTLDIAPGDVRRVVATSWHPDALGDPTRWPHADVFALSPDMLAHRRQESWRAGQRDLWVDLLPHVQSHPELGERAQGVDLDAYLHAALPPTRDDLPVTPLRDGHVVAAGDLRLEVVAAAGPDPGHMLLHDPDRGLLFCGDLLGDPLPARVHSVGDHLAALERASELPADLALPNHGRPDDTGARALSWSLRRMTNFLQSASMILSDGPTVFDFAARDLGIDPHDILRYMGSLLTYRALLDELVRARFIDAAGEGYARRYGLSPDDPHLDDDTKLRGRLAPVPVTGPSPFER